MIRNALRSFFIKESFTRDVAIISGGKLIVAAIGFFFIPVLARIYPPDAYGFFSIYAATINILVILFPLAYPFTLVIEKDEKTFHNLFILSLILTVTGALITLIIIMFYGKVIISLFSLNLPAYFLYFIPAGIMINGLVIILSHLNIRRKNYALSASLEAGGNLLIRIINLGYGLLTAGNALGLIIGNQSGMLTAGLVNLFKNYKREFITLKKSLSWSNMRLSMIKHKNYPRYILPGQILNTLRGNLPVYFIGGGFGSVVLGSFSMSTTLLNIPIQIAANSLSSVFLKHATDMHKQPNQNLSVFTHKLANRLFLIGLFPFSYLFVFGEEALSFFLGAEWRQAGLFASYLCPYFFLYIIFTPLYSLVQIHKKEKFILYISILTLILNTVSLIYGMLITNISATILLFSASNIFVSLLQGWYIFKLEKLNFLIFIIKVIISFILSTIVFWGIRLWFY